MNAHRAVEQAARESYGRLMAYLTVNWRDVEAAEDALADAFLQALGSWPRDGVPDRPEAWLLTAARRRLVDRARRHRVHERAVPELIAMAEEAQQHASCDAPFPDERLRMLFICAHPAIDPGMRTPLMLQTVLGIDAARIASAFLVKPATMGQRLSRAKARIRTDGLPLELPESERLPERLDAVLEAVYAAYGSGWDDVAGVDPRRRGLTEEAIYLGRLLARLMPDQPEAHGLLALMLHCEARREARRDDAGGYVPLAEQDVRRWSASLAAEAERCLHDAAGRGRIGRFQLMAAIQSVHAERARTGQTRWEEIALLYEALVRIAPTTGSRVGHAAAVAEARGDAAGLDLLAAIPAAETSEYQPYWALKACLHRRLGHDAAAADAYSRAIGLSTDPSVRAFLRAQAASSDGESADQLQ